MAHAVVEHGRPARIALEAITELRIDMVQTYLRGNRRRPVRIKEVAEATGLTSDKIDQLLVTMTARDTNLAETDDGRLYYL